MIKTIEWREDKVFMIDQRKLPDDLEIISCSNHYEVADAIKDMAIRGAPAIGAAAAYGMALAAKNYETDDISKFINYLEKARDLMAATRPTAVNLFWALGKIWELTINSDIPVKELRDKIISKAKEIAETDIQTNYKIGENGVQLFDDGDIILTHCNAGSLATVFYGTALGVIRSVYRQKRNIKVFVDETRPVLQGARLTAWELLEEKIPATLICDSVAGFLMSRGEISKVIVGADRIGANGDVANKIGTYSISVLAKEHNIPFYVAAPFTTIDFEINNGNEIKIEERRESEVTTIMGRRIAPIGIDVYNPAFDVTPNKNISAIITEKGIVKPPFFTNLKRLIKLNKCKKN